MRYFLTTSIPMKILIDHCDDSMSRNHGKLLVLNWVPRISAILLQKLSHRTKFNRESNAIPIFANGNLYNYKIITYLFQRNQTCICLPNYDPLIEKVLEPNTRPCVVSLLIICNSFYFCSIAKWRVEPSSSRRKVYTAFYFLLPPTPFLTRNKIEASLNPRFFLRPIRWLLVSLISSTVHFFLPLFPLFLLERVGRYFKHYFLSLEISPSKISVKREQNNRLSLFPPSAVILLIPNPPFWNELRYNEFPSRRRNKASSGFSGRKTLQCCWDRKLLQCCLCCKEPEAFPQKWEIYLLKAD